MLATPIYASVTQPETVPLAPLEVHTTTTRNIVDALNARHYVTASLDDELSSRILDSYIEDLDASRSYFLAADVKSFEKYRKDMDNSLRKGELQPAFEMFNVYHERLTHRFEWVIALLEKGVEQFDFTVDESLELDREESPWANTQEELDELWRKRIKHAVLNLTLAEKEPEKIKELLLKRYQNRLSRSMQTNSEDVYQLYMNSFTRTYDPHTQYFSPRTSENFNINMSLSLEGIGAVLQREDEYTKVVSLVTGGPADLGNELEPDDKIIAVGQQDSEEMIDVIGWRLDEVVQLIRGKKDTVVKLDVIPASENDASHSRIIKITRNTVKLEEQSAKSKVIEIEQYGSVRKIGVIDIPTFYIDFKALQQGDRNYKSTTRDVRNLLTELMEQDVEGVIIDLRDNGGGSLQEANTLTGLFIDRGPTVQIRSKSNRVDILNDRDFRTIYDGPLVVMVNRLSASASEIFAGAIQDYQRGIIIGSQTFGKGTVQSLLPLNRGQLKLTQAKFYRISGESTQHQGVIPDVIFPANYDLDSIGESSLDDPLKWDKIQPTSYRTKANLGSLVPELISQHLSRVSSDPEFSYITDALNYRKSRSQDTNVSLNLAERIQEKETADDFWLSLENRKRLALGQLPVASLDDLDDDESAPVASSTTPATGITAASETVNNGESSETLTGNEMAVVTESPAEGGRVNSPAKADPEEDEEEEDSDAFLVESSFPFSFPFSCPAPARCS